MKATIMTATGNPDALVYQDLPEPEISQPTQIKVKLMAAGVNPVDTKIRRNGLFYGNHPPAVLGCDGAGIVVETGADVHKFQVGDKVWFCHGGLGREQGNYAEFNVLDERWAARMQQSLAFIQAAALPLVLITAWGALYVRGGLQQGQTVLIHAGAGGVGHVAIQLAKIKGARVITTVSTREKAEFVKDLGVDEIVYYTRSDVAEAVMQLTGGKGADLVFDTVGGEVFKTSVASVAHFGRLISILGMVDDFDFNEARMRNLLIGFELMLTPMLRDLHLERDKHIDILNHCADYVEQNLLRVHVSNMFDLQDAKQAHELIEGGHVSGKLVLVMDKP